MLGHARRRGAYADWTFYCTQAAPGALEAVARNLGATVVRSPVPLGDQMAFARALRAELRLGRYDVLHCHHDLVSGLYLAASAGLPIRRRIVHAHNADESVLTPSVVKAQFLRPALRLTCFALADRLVGISNHTLDTLLGGRPRRPGRDLVHYYGIDPLAPMTSVAARAAFRSGLGLAPDAPILLFGGRIVPEKNPVFAIDVLSALRQALPNAVAVFAGDGSQREAVIHRARAMGIEDAVRMLGWRDDLPLLMALADWFILPRPEHPMEGFGIAVVEAQLACTRLLLSRGVPDDPLLPTAVYRRLSLCDTPATWARAALELFDEPAPSSAATLAAHKASPMDMDRALAELLQLHA